MGVRNMMQFIKRYAPNAINITTKINNYANSILGIDANLLLYKIIYAIRLHKPDFKYDNKITTHIHGLLQKLIAFKKYNIKAIFVFDGMAPDIKLNELIKRKNSNQNISLSEDEIRDAIELIKIFGFDVQIADGEADIVLAQLSRNKLIDYVVSDDLDIIVFGGLNILKDFTIDMKKNITLIDTIKMKRILKYDNYNLIDLAILLGCDYCASIKGIGVVAAYELILMHKYRDLKYIAHKENITLPVEYNDVINYFMVGYHNKISYQITNNKLNINNLKQFLKRFNYPDDKINKIINKIILL